MNSKDANKGVFVVSILNSGAVYEIVDVLDCKCIIKAIAYYDRIEEPFVGDCTFLAETSLLEKEDPRKHAVRELLFLAGVIYDSKKKDKMYKLASIVERIINLFADCIDVEEAQKIDNMFREARSSTELKNLAKSIFDLCKCGRKMEPLIK